MKTPSDSTRRAFSTNCLRAALAALLCSAPGGSAAIPAPERLLPDDTLVVFSVPDFTKMRDIYRDSPQAGFWYDPALKAFREKFTAKLNEELVGPLERELGTPLDAFANLPQGQLTVALTQNGWHGTADPLPAILLLLDARDRGSQLKTNLAVLRRKWVESGKSIKTEKIRDIEFTVLPISDKDIPAALKKLYQSDEDGEDATNKSPGSELVFGQFESLLIAGNSTKAIEKVMAHLTGGSSPALGDVPAFEANRMAIFRDAPMYGWINVKPLIDVLIKSASQRDADNPNPMSFFSPEKILNALGLGGLKTVAFGIRNSSEGAYCQIFVGVPESSRQGLFKLLPAAGKESGPPPFVPADAVTFHRIRIDGQQAWATLEKIVNDVSPGAVSMGIEAANAAAKEKDPNFDIRKNLIGNLGDDLISYSKMPHGGQPAAGLKSPPALFLIGSPHSEEFAGALKSILSLMGQGAPAEREFLGRKIYTIAQPEAMAAGRGSRLSLSFAASGGYVALTDDVPMLEEYLRSSDSQQKKLREIDGLSDATAKVGGASSGWFGYENQSETTRIAFEALRKSGAAEGGDKMLTPDIPAFAPDSPLKDWFDFSLLPPFDKIAKYFYFMVYSGGSSADGYSFKMYYPVPPGLRK